MEIEMLEQCDSEPKIDVQESEYVRLLGYPPHRELSGRGLEIAEQTRAWYAEHGSPWLYLRSLKSVEVSESGIVVDGVAFESSRLREQFSEAEADLGFVVVASAGKECEERARELWAEGKPDEYFFMEMYGSAVVEHLVTRAGASLCEWADPRGIAILPHYSPGYPEWDVSEQVKLLDLIESGRGEIPMGEIRTFDTGMLRPKKSLLALFGGTRSLDKVRSVATLIPCESCSLAGCSYRRVPYYLDTIEKMDSAETLEEKRSEMDSPRVALNQDAPYSVHKKALRKWTEARLNLREEGDAMVAEFLYEGTTCSNMGHPLQYMYSITVAGSDQKYEILDAQCAPVEGHLGYKKQCEFLKVGESLNEAISQEKPLLGEPLESVFQWSHRSGSSGCYCDMSGRNHKWGLAYEVVHYALAQREAALKEANAS